MPAGLLLSVAPLRRGGGAAVSPGIFVYLFVSLGERQERGLGATPAIAPMRAPLFTYFVRSFVVTSFEDGNFAFFTHTHSRHHAGFTRGVPSAGLRWVPAEVLHKS